MNVTEKDYFWKDNFFDEPFIILKEDVLKVEYDFAEYRLVLCTGGNGCNPEHSGKSVFVTFLDSDRSTYTRNDILGIPTREFITEWYKEYGAEIRSDSFKDEIYKIVFETREK